jgi:hypothetical protein
MAIHCDRFYVSLSASQARRRLKGHGFGVKKVESAGNNRAVIIHTATGENLAQLVMLFQDVVEPWDEPIVRVLLENPTISDAELMERYKWLVCTDRSIASARQKAKLRANQIPVPETQPPWLYYLP